MAGGGAMVSAATGALGSVLEKLAAMLGGACVRLMGVRGEVLFLRAELEHMSAFLVKLSRVEDPDEQAQCWMAEVRELSYDIEDTVDEFTLCLDVDDRSAHPLPGFRGFIDRSINLLTKIKTRRRVAMEIQGLKDRVKEVSERREHLRAG